jgi:hypothetical protein
MEITLTACGKTEMYPAGVDSHTSHRQAGGPVCSRQITFQGVINSRTSVHMYQR